MLLTYVFPFPPLYLYDEAVIRKYLIEFKRSGNSINHAILADLFAISGSERMCVRNGRN